MHHQREQKNNAPALRLRVFSAFQENLSVSFIFHPSHCVHFVIKTFKAFM